MNLCRRAGCCASPHSLLCIRDKLPDTRVPRLVSCLAANDAVGGVEGHPRRAGGPPRPNVVWTPRNYGHREVLYKRFGCRLLTFHGVAGCYSRSVTGTDTAGNATEMSSFVKLLDTKSTLLEWSDRKHVPSCGSQGTPPGTSCEDDTINEGSSMELSIDECPLSPRSTVAMPAPRSLCHDE